VCVFVIREKRMIYFIYTDGEKKRTRRTTIDRGIDMMMKEKREGKDCSCCTI
jgi:hypothetical protein